MRLQHEAGTLQFRGLHAFQHRVALAHALGKVPRIHNQQTMQAEVADQLEVALTHPRQDQAAPRHRLAQLQRGTRQHAEKRAVHARTVLEIEHESSPALLQQLADEIAQTSAVLKTRAAVDSDDHGVGRSIDEVDRLGGRRGHCEQRKKRIDPPEDGSSAIARAVTQQVRRTDLRKYLSIGRNRPRRSQARARGSTQFFATIWRST